jgi:glycosyltransferase involved in cell wall biosynthesis
VNKLTIGYSSLAERVRNIKFIDSYNNILVVQNPNQISFEMPKAPNLKTIMLSSKGVAKSRNQALQHCESGYLLFADDDITFNNSGIEAAIAYLENHPKCDLLLLQAVNPAGELRKRYPIKAQKLTKFNSAKAATYEMIVRVPAVKNLGVKFDENFGAGAENYLGDEYIFITDLLKAGGKGEFLPITIATHPDESSATPWRSDAALKARAAIFSRVFGPLALFVRLGFILRARQGVGLVGFIKFVIGR